MLYAYCVVDEQIPDASLSTGVSGKEIKSFEHGGLIALASEFEGDTVGIKRENVIKHDEIVRGVLEKITPLPFRFGTLVTDTQLRDFLHSRRDALKLKLDEVRDSVEMSVKVIWSPAPSEIRELKTGESIGSQGTAFLRAKRREILGDEARVEAAEELKSWLKQRVSPLVRAELVTLRPSQKLVLAASHLVERRQLQKYQEAVRTTVSERPNLHFLTSGPWAPYSFANIDLEFKTQFGVS